MKKTAKNLKQGGKKFKKAGKTAKNSTENAKNVEERQKVVNIDQKFEKKLLWKQKTVKKTCKKIEERALTSCKKV